MKILLMGGTSETGPLLQALCEADAGLGAAAAQAGSAPAILLCTATEEALSVPPELLAGGKVRRICGRLDRAALAELIRTEQVTLAVCAVHPYAEAARENLLAAAAGCGVSCPVYLRPASESPSFLTDVPLAHAATHTEAAAAAVRLARELRGTILLTTGSRHLSEYAQAAQVAGVKVYARVLDCSESREALAAAGIPPEQAVFGKGPFSLEDNLRQIAACGVRVLVSKDSGEAGGVREKFAAARQAKCAVVLVARPEFCGEAFRTIPDLLAAIRLIRNSQGGSPSKKQVAKNE